MAVAVAVRVLLLFFAVRVPVALVVSVVVPARLLFLFAVRVSVPVRMFFLRLPVTVAVIVPVPVRLLFLFAVRVSVPVRVRLLLPMTVSVVVSVVVPMALTTIISMVMSTLLLLFFPVRVSVPVRMVRAVARHAVVRVPVRLLRALNLGFLLHHHLTLARHRIINLARQCIFSSRLTTLNIHQRHHDVFPARRAPQRHVPRRPVDLHARPRRERRRHHVHLSRVRRYLDHIRMRRARKPRLESRRELHKPLPCRALVVVNRALVVIMMAPVPVPVPVPVRRRRRRERCARIHL